VAGSSEEDDRFALALVGIFMVLAVLGIFLMSEAGITSEPH
jgi:hypothetical protein